jgi:hypothetical protein
MPNKKQNECTPRHLEYSAREQNVRGRLLAGELQFMILSGEVKIDSRNIISSDISCVPSSNIYDEVEHVHKAGIPSEERHLRLLEALVRRILFAFEVK